MPGIKHWILICVVSASLTACQAFSFLRAGPKQPVNQLVAESRYGEALQTLERLRKKSPSEQIEARIAATTEQASRYDRRQAEEARQLHNRGDWGGALQMLETALEKYPQGEHLQRTHTLLKNEQSQLLRQLRSELLLAKSEWLIHSNRLYKEILQANPDEQPIRAELNRTQRELTQVTEDLTQLGKLALEQGELEIADQCLAMANRLQPQDESLALLAQLNQIRFEQQQKQLAKTQRAERQRLREQIEEQKKRAEIKRVEKQKRDEVLRREQERHKEEVRRLSLAVHRALAEGKLSAARRLLGQLRTKDNRNPELTRLEQSLDEAINAKVTQLLKIGNSYYSNGQIREARSIWLAAIELDPKNDDIRNRITRANRVLGRLQELQKRESAAQ